MPDDRPVRPTQSWTQGARAFLQRSIDRPWYGPLIGFLSGLDLFAVFIPVDAIMFSSIVVMPRRWAWFGFWIAFGSFLGAFLLVWSVQNLGLPWVLEVFPGMDQTAAWIWTDRFLERYGVLLVFLTALSPLIQQPTLILATLSGVPVPKMMALYFLGRMMKSLILAYLASYAPHILGRLLNCSLCLWTKPTDSKD